MTNVPATIGTLKSSGRTKEYILNYLVKHNKVILHGSRVDVSSSFLRPNRNGKVFATNDARIAILKAIFSNRELQSPGLEYPYFINERNPLTLRIHGINKETIGDIGFVYIISEIVGFVNTPQGSWQYVKKKESVPFSDRLDILRSDFIYPVYDVTNRRKIQ